MKLGEGHPIQDFLKKSLPRQSCARQGHPSVKLWTLRSTGIDRTQKPELEAGESVFGRIRAALELHRNGHRNIQQS
jgi:hypothetical protein